MRKFLSLIFSILILSNIPSFAEGDLWDNFGDQNYYGNKGAVSDEEFDKAIESKKREKPPKKMKGESIQQSDETNAINQIPKELPVVCISTPIQINEDAVLPIGHYQVVGENRGDKIYLKLYQGHYLMAEFEAEETLEDFNEPEVSFVNFITDKDNKLKIIFGSIDFNAFATVNPAQPD